jgi:hypothetical protein
MKKAHNNGNAKRIQANSETVLPIMETLKEFKRAVKPHLCLFHKEGHHRRLTFFFGNVQGCFSFLYVCLEAKDRQAQARTQEKQHDQWNVMYLVREYVTKERNC